MNHPPSINPPRALIALRVVAAALVAVLALVACGDKKGKTASQVAAKVNKEEISVHQINFALQSQRGLRADQAELASRQILERLIDQELAIQKGQELKVERDPRVVQQIEAARREIVARAYVEKISEGAAKPSAEEVKKYYDEKAALFKERRIYNIQEIAVEAKPDQVGTLRTQLAGAKTIAEFTEWLKANGYRFAANQAVRSAEQLPLNMVDTFARMKDGQAMLVPTATGAQVVVLAGSKSEPVDEARARPAIEQFLLNESRRKLVEADMKALRAAAKIEYVGKFAEGAASAPAGAAVVAPVVAPASAAPVVAPSAPASAGGLSADDISKGMGLKK